MKGSWREENQGFAHFGRSVAIDGDYAVLGAPYEGGLAGTERGAVYIFEWIDVLCKRRFASFSWVKALKLTWFIDSDLSRPVLLYPKVAFLIWISPSDGIDHRGKIRNFPPEVVNSHKKSIKYGSRRLCLSAWFVSRDSPNRMVRTKRLGEKFWNDFFKQAVVW